eukprot:2767445-Rhodomonas_salina.1
MDLTSKHRPMVQWRRRSQERAPDCQVQVQAAQELRCREPDCRDEKERHRLPDCAGCGSREGASQPRRSR